MEDKEREKEDEENWAGQWMYKREQEGRRSERENGREKKGEVGKQEKYYFSFPFLFFIKY